jgi:hypothetical protein
MALKLFLNPFPLNSFGNGARSELALNPCAGGRLAFCQVFFGFFSNCFSSFCISPHSSTIKASFASSVSYFRSGSFFIPSFCHFLTFVMCILPRLSNYVFVPLVHHFSSLFFLAFRYFTLIFSLFLKSYSVMPFRDDVKSKDHR